MFNINKKRNFKGEDGIISDKYFEKMLKNLKVNLLQEDNHIRQNIFMKNLILIVIIAQSFSLSRLCAQNGWTETVGTYFLNSGSTNIFPEFYCFTLEPANYYKNIDTSLCSVHLNIAYSKDNLVGVDCRLKEFCMTSDSLSFCTDECQDNQYLFSGEFLVPLSEVYHNMYKTVLKGVLKWYKNGQLFRKGKVSFTFEMGC